MPNWFGTGKAPVVFVPIYYRYQCVTTTELLEGSQRAFMGNADCTPGYYNNEGKPVGRREKLNGSGYPDGPVAYFQYIDRWRTSGQFEGLEFRT